MVAGIPSRSPRRRSETTKRAHRQVSRHVVRKPSAATKAAEIEIARKAAADDAIEAILSACFNQWTANEEVVLSGADPEGVHQMRVALRRMRSALSDFKEIIPAAQLAWSKRETKWLVTSLGAARDWDVFVAELLAPVMTARPKDSSLERLRAAADTERKDGYVNARHAIRSPRYAALVSRMGSWLSAREWSELDDGERKSGSESATELAARLLKRRHKAVIKRGREFTELSPLQRHKLRIALKKLRYTAEFFSSLFPRKRQKAYLDALSRLQDSLGHMNDVVVADHLLQRLSARRSNRPDHLSVAMGIVVGWHAHNASSSEHDTIDNWREFCGCDVFW